MSPCWTFLVLCGFLGRGNEATSPWNTHSGDFDYEPLALEEELPVILSRAETFYVNKGDSVFLPCDVKNLGNYSVIWRKGRTILWVLQGNPKGTYVQKVTQNDRFILNGTAMIIENTTEEDDHSYTCELSTRPYARNIDHVVFVRVPPSVVPANNRSIVITRSGESVSLTCDPTGKPLPAVTWKKKGGGMRGHIDNTSLTIYRVTYKDAGDYICTASNNIGMAAHATITLRVRHPPVVRAENDVVYGGVSYDAMLSCFVIADPRAQVKWHKGISPVDPLRLKMSVNAENRYSLWFAHVYRSDLGTYRCTATNFEGNSSANVILTGKPKPVKVVSSPKGEHKTNYTLVWEVESYAPLLNYLVSYKNMTDPDDMWVNITVPGTLVSSTMIHSQSCTLTDLVPGSSYAVRVWATNEFGTSTLGDLFRFRTSDLEHDVQDEASDLDHQAEVDEESQGQKGIADISDSEAARSTALSSASGRPDFANDQLANEEHQSNHKKPLEPHYRESASTGDHTSKGEIQHPNGRLQTAAWATVISLSCFFF